MFQTQKFSHEVYVTPFMDEAEFKSEEEKLALARLFNSTREGLNIIYELVLPRQTGPFALVTPWSYQVGCPRCYGQGLTFTQLDQPGEYRAVTCPRCGGQGYLESVRPIALNVTEEMAEAGTIRLEGAGVYDSETLRRGDLIINLNFVNVQASIH